MKSALVIIALIWIIASTVAIAALIFNVSALKDLINAQDELIANIGVTLNGVIGEVKDLDSEIKIINGMDLGKRIDQINRSLAYQQKTIDRVRAYAYNEVNHEPVDL